MLIQLGCVLLTQLCITSDYVKYVHYIIITILIFCYYHVTTYTEGHCLYNEYSSINKTKSL